MFSSGLFKGAAFIFLLVCKERQHPLVAAAVGERTRREELRNPSGDQHCEPLAQPLPLPSQCAEGERPTILTGTMDAVLQCSVKQFAAPHWAEQQERADEVGTSNSGGGEGEEGSVAQPIPLTEWMGSLHALLSPEPIAVPKPSPTTGPGGMQP